MSRSTSRPGVFLAAVAVLVAGSGSVFGQVAPPAPTPTATPTPTPAPGTGYQPTYMPCREGKFPREGMLDTARRELYETLCGATLWLDGLFGRYGSLEWAERVNGRAELSVLRSNLQGTKLKTGLDVNVRLPHLEQRLHAFFGRSDPQDYVRDRQEGFGLRSQFASLENQEKWLGGLGYSLPGAAGEHLSFRAGVAGGIHATVFGQAVYRQNVVVSDHDLWRLREVAFWRSREGFGFTSSADYDHILTRNLLLRWGSVGTVSEGSHGLDWRSALVLYQNLHSTRAIAYEAFARGVTGTTGLTEYGGRLIYRQSAFRPWFFVDLVGGYSWLRLDPGQPLQGTTSVGVGGELWFGPGQQ